MVIMFIKINNYNLFGKLISVDACYMSFYVEVFIQDF